MLEVAAEVKRARMANGWQYEEQSAGKQFLRVRPGQGCLASLPTPYRTVQSVAAADAELNVMCDNLRPSVCVWRRNERPAATGLAVVSTATGRVV